MSTGIFAGGGHAGAGGAAGQAAGRERTGRGGLHISRRWRSEVELSRPVLVMAPLRLVHLAGTRTHKGAARSVENLGGHAGSLAGSEGGAGAGVRSAGASGRAAG